MRHISLIRYKTRNKAKFYIGNEKVE